MKWNGDHVWWYIPVISVLMRSKPYWAIYIQKQNKTNKTPPNYGVSWNLCKIKFNSV